MQKISMLILMNIFTLGTMFGCVSDSSGINENPNNKQNSENRIDWESVPSDYNPSTQDTVFEIGGYKKIDFNLFGFRNDVEVLYSSSISSNSILLRTYKVWKKTNSSGNLRKSSLDDTLKISEIGLYSCSIKVENHEITDLEGSCIVRLQIFLPPNANIEVYNLNELVSKRLFPIGVPTLLNDLNNSYGYENKRKTIETFLNSYSSLKKRPSFSSEQLGIVINNFRISEDKFDILKKLQSFVSDRENLNSMVEDSFYYYDREEARKILKI